MIKRITKVGNSQGIMLDAALMDLARLKVGDEVNVTVHEGGAIYLTVAVAGGLAFLLLAWRLFRSRAGDEPDKAEAVGREAALYDVRAQAKPARDLFAFSILYLMALFAALLVEALPGVGG